jgi:hypothetical protein
MNALHTAAIEAALSPRITLAQRVVDQIVQNALRYETETGEALIGLPIPVPGRSEPDLIVLETVPPDESAVRENTYFEQGDEEQGYRMAWLFDNWNDLRETPNNGIDPRYNVELSHVGDWHKHPGTMTFPSGGDEDTAIAHVTDSHAGKPYLLAILATVWDRTLAHLTDYGDALYNGAKPIKVDIGDRKTVRLDCWYMSRAGRRFIHLSPTVIPDSQLPQLPALSWHLAHPEALGLEVKLLQESGYSVSIDEWDTDQRPPRELCITLAKRGSPRIVIVATHADYPKSRPIVYTVPMAAMREIPEGAKLFQALWKRAQPLPADAYPGWDATHTLAHYLAALDPYLQKDHAS